MRLEAFQIRNFRSIKDSGRCWLSTENINVLIGQNEAGKSSILEALMAFQTGEVAENDIRSDASDPLVCCEYALNQSEVQGWFSTLDLSIEGAWQSEIDWTNALVSVTASWHSTEKNNGQYTFSCAETESILEAIVSKCVTTNLETQSREQNLTGVVVSATELEAGIAVRKAAIDAYKIQLTAQLVNALLEKIPSFVLFNDTQCLLPSTIDIINNELCPVDGRVGAQNFLTVAGLDLVAVVNTPARHRASMLEDANQRVTMTFQDLWTQHIGKSQKIELQCDLEHYGPTAPLEKRGFPHLVFYISEANDKLYPNQRSKGVRWFLSFFLQMSASAKAVNSVIYLLDEPGANLHSKAQQDVLQVMERASHANQIIYSTHSPDLLKADKLGRVLAVQRDDAEDNSSPTVIISAHKLSGASIDTMSAVYRAMGVDFSRQQVIQHTNNVLLEELSALYYLKAYSHLTKLQNTPNFLPATGVTNIPMIANLLTGWGLEFIVVLDDDPKGRAVAKTLAKELFLNDESVIKARIHRVKHCDGIEDLFDPIDYCRHILLQPEITLTTKPSEAAKTESKAMLAYQFWCRVENGEITLADLTLNTKSNIDTLLESIKEMLDNYQR